MGVNDVPGGESNAEWQIRRGWAMLRGRAMHHTGVGPAVDRGMSCHGKVKVRLDTRQRTMYIMSTNTT